jgi:hypothetical protein
VRAKRLRDALADDIDSEKRAELRNNHINSSYNTFNYLIANEIIRYFVIQPI